jgi:hypothetical protein
VGFLGFCFLSFWDKVSTSWSFCLSFPSAGITDVFHHSWLCKAFPRRVSRQRLALNPESCGSRSCIPDC